MTNESNTPDIDYALTLMDCWGRDENQSGPGGACRLAAQVIRFLSTSPEPETLVVTKTFNEALKELISGPYQPWQVTKLQLDHQQAEITQLRGNLSLAEEGLASSMQEIERLQRANDTLHLNLQIARRESSDEPSEPTCEWSEIEEGTGIYNTCKDSEEFHLTEGLDLYPFCQWCGRRIEVTQLPG